VDSTPDHDVSGKVWLQAPNVTIDNGWLDMVLAMQVLDAGGPWNGLCRRAGLFSTTLGFVDGGARAWLTRDAVGWSHWDSNLVETVAAEDGTKVWPWLWLRQPVSHHAHLQRVQRLHADLRWMAGCVQRRMATT
jgi:hypothetical protein